MFKYYEMHILGSVEEISRETAVAILDERDVSLMEDIAEMEGSYVDEAGGVIVEYEED